jgi:hypothetical protein
MRVCHTPPWRVWVAHANRGGPTLGLGGAWPPQAPKFSPKFFFSPKKKKIKIKILPPNFLIFLVFPPQKKILFDLAPPFLPAWVRHCMPMSILASSGRYDVLYPCSSGFFLVKLFCYKINK